MVMGLDRSLFDYQYHLDYVLDKEFSAAESTAAKNHDSKVKKRMRASLRVSEGIQQRTEFTQAGTFCLPNHYKKMVG